MEKIFLHVCTCECVLACVCVVKIWVLVEGVGQEGEC
jgi:hypothetical protein